jgi:hypothetical protein
MKSDAATPLEYLAELPEDRRRIVSTVRDVIRAHLAEGIVEGMVGGMISYHVPLEVFPGTANCHPLRGAALTNQKRHVSLYMLGISAKEGGPEWLRDEWAATGKRVDVGKSCMRFTRLEDIPRLVIGDAITKLDPDSLIADHLRAHVRRGGRKR